MKQHILFVCLGNICRSPAAEGIFRQMVEQQGLAEHFVIDSAGTAGYHVGELPDARMRRHGAAQGYRFDSHARRFSAADFGRFDLIVVMDDANYDDVASLADDAESAAKIRRMADFLPSRRYDHIPDPYYMGAEGFELVIDLLEEGAAELLRRLQSKD